MNAPRSGRSSADTRTRILEVAGREFAREGFAGAHLQGIAGQVGVQKTALYYYFPSKKDLYAAVLVDMLETFENALVEPIDGSGTIEERSERLLDRVNDVLAENRNYSQLLIRVFVDRVPVPGDVVLPPIERLVGRLLRFLREGVESGVFAGFSERNLFQTILGAIVFHYASDAFGAVVLEVDDVFDSGAVSWRGEELRRFVLRGLLKKPAGD